MTFRKIADAPQQRHREDRVTYAWRLLNDSEEEMLCIDLLRDQAITYSEAARALQSLLDEHGYPVTVHRTHMRHWMERQK